MKKFFVFAIAALCMVSCGKKAEEAKEAAETEAQAQDPEEAALEANAVKGVEEMNNEEKATYYAQELTAAAVANNEERKEELAAEIGAWVETLSDEDKAAVEAIFEQAAAAAAETVQE